MLKDIETRNITIDSDNYWLIVGPWPMLEQIIATADQLEKELGECKRTEVPGRNGYTYKIRLTPKNDVSATEPATNPTVL